MTPMSVRSAATTKPRCTVCGGEGNHFFADHEPVYAESAAKLDLARLLLTPAALDADEWVKGRIRWHRLDGNDELADEMLRDENSVRSAIRKEPLDA